LKSYPKYKDSEVEWIENIPLEWESIRLQYISNIDTSGIWGEDEPGDELIPLPIPTTGQLTIEGRWIYDKMSIRYVTKEEFDYYRCVEGDIVVVKSSGSSTNIITGKCGYITPGDSEKFGFGNFLLRVKSKKLIPKLTYYFLQSNLTKQRIERMVSSTTYPNLQVNEYVKTKLFVPPKSEQSQIVKVLDNRTQNIDQLVDLTEKKIEILKEQRTTLINHCVTKGLNPNVGMKDSGVEWIGEIPSHWFRTKISRFCEVKDGTHDTPKFLDPNEETIPLVTSNSFINGEIDFTKSKHISVEDHMEINKRSDVQINDIIMSMIGSNIGNRVLVKTDSPFSIKNVCLFKTSKLGGLVPKYLLNLIDSKYLMYQVDFNQKGGGQPFLSLNELRNLIFPFPPENEQNQIVEHLDKLTQKIDTTIKIESKRIDLLKEYRQSLISEVVTGKIDVRDWND
jgi:type I restriction enzyme, S subunit